MYRLTLDMVDLFCSIFSLQPSPRCSGYPQMLLELALEFESHVGRTFEIVCKNESKRHQLLRGPNSMGGRNSMRVNEGRKG